MAQVHIGAAEERAERNLRRSIELSREIKDLFWDAAGNNGLARVLSYRGEWQEAEQRLDFSFKYHTKKKDYQGLSVDWSYRALRFLLMARTHRQSKIANLKSAIEAASRGT